MSQHSSRPSTALMRVDDKLTDWIAQRIFEWNHALGRPLVRMYVTTDGNDGLALEYVDPKASSAGESYLVVVTTTNHIVGVVRDGLLDAEPHRLPPSRAACTLFRAAKA